MNPEVVNVLCVVIGIVIGFAIEYAWVKKSGGSQTAAAASAAATIQAWEAKGKTDMASALDKAHSIIADLTAKLHPSAAPPAASTGTGSGTTTTSAAPAVPWELGTSYSSVQALLADAQHLPATTMVRLDGSAIANFAGTTYADFYTAAGGMVTQTKPA